MTALGLGLVGILIGVAGSEFLRTAKPDFVKKVEESAKRFVARFGMSGRNRKG